jgi:hypothetical protein
MKMMKVSYAPTDGVSVSGLYLRETSTRGQFGDRTLFVRQGHFLTIHATSGIDFSSVPVAFELSPLRYRSFRPDLLAARDMARNIETTTKR